MAYPPALFGAIMYILIAPFVFWRRRYNDQNEVVNDDKEQEKANDLEMKDVDN